MKIYCLKCKDFTESSQIKSVSVHKRLQLKAKCVVCHSKKCQFVSKAAYKSFSSDSEVED